MAEKKITRKVISRTPAKETAVSSEQPEADRKSVARVKKVCFFCQNKTNPSYTDIVVLRRFTSDRAKIVSRAKNGLCSKHQRAVGRHIKYARHLSLLPFVPAV